MSGSGGGGAYDAPIRPPAKPREGGGGGQDGPAGAPDVCAIDELTVLNSPNRAVTTSLRPGQQLQVRYDPGPPQRLLADVAPGATAGSITSPSMAQMIACIVTHGVLYVADVVSVRGAAVQVRIHPA